MGIGSLPRFVAAVGFCASLVASLHATAQLADEGSTQSVDASIRTTLASLGSSRPVAPLKRAKLSMEMLSRPNVSVSEVESRYEYLGDGLWVCCRRSSAQMALGRSTF